MFSTPADVDAQAPETDVNRYRGSIFCAFSRHFGDVTPSNRNRLKEKTPIWLPLRFFLGLTNPWGWFVRTFHRWLSGPGSSGPQTACPTEHIARINPDLSPAQPALFLFAGRVRVGFFSPAVLGSRHRGRFLGIVATGGRLGAAPREHPPLPGSEGCERSNTSARNRADAFRRQSSSTKPVPFRRSRPACQNRSPA